MRPLILLPALAALALSTTAAAQSPTASPDAPARRSSSAVHHGTRGSNVPLRRWEVAAGTGLTAAVLTGVPQAAPTAQLNLGYAVTPRILVGVAYGRAVFSPRPYVDENGVTSRERNTSQHFGARVKGVILRRGGTHVYGGLQLGVTTSDPRYEHDFPAALRIEDEATYLHERPSPFYDPGSQVGAIGFLGVATRVLPHVELYGELGNNLALLSAGAAVVF